MSVLETFFSVPVGDMKRATAFYVDALGATVSFATPIWSSLHIAGVRVGLFPGAPGGRIGLHFVIDDEPATRAAIEAAGGRMAQPIEVAPGVFVIDATDSEGNIFQLRRA